MCSKMMDNIRAVRSGEISVEEIATGRLALLERENPAVNAVVECRPEELLSRARELDKKIAQGKAGKMAGAIITVKDNLDVEGMKSTAGLANLKNNVALTDSDIVARLKNAGALILGKTNMPPRAMDVQTDNPVYGRTNHPVFHGRTCGGSSGGGACAVSLGISDIDIGNDIMGSIRIPAHFCGVYGFIPTGGAVWLEGLAGAGGPAGSTLSKILRIGMQTKDVQNIEYALPMLLHAGYPARAPEKKKKLKIAWSLNCGGLPLSKESGKCFEGFLKRLSGTYELYELGADDYDFDTARECFTKLLYGAMAAMLPPPAYFATRYLMRNKLFNKSLKDFLDAENKREQLVRSLERLFGRADCLITPVTATPAFPHMKPDRMFGSQPIYDAFEVDGAKTNYATANLGYTTPFFTANPVISMPICKTGEGLPIGAQVVCGHYEEYKLLDIVQSLSESAL